MCGISARKGCIYSGRWAVLRLRFFSTASGGVDIAADDYLRGNIGYDLGNYSRISATRWNVNDILSSLMLNYVAIQLLIYLMHGLMRDPLGNNFPQTKILTESAKLAHFSDAFTPWAVTLAGLVIALTFLGGEEAQIVLGLPTAATDKSRLVLRAVGENHDAAHALGYNVILIRIGAITFGAATAGIGGAYLSMVYTPHWSEGITAGRGWIALALVVFSSWKPARLMAGAYLFGLILMSQLYLQGLGKKIILIAAAAVLLVGVYLLMKKPATPPAEEAKSTESQAGKAMDKIKVGFIYVGPVGDHGWTYRHDEGRKAMMAKLGDKVETTFVESVPEADSERAIRKMAQDGNNLVFTTSFGFMDPTPEGGRGVSRCEV
ncbi:hypothetical protein CHS0354_006919 [Potamilus streckersoni]|uniref:ABC transporter substrate-binding protein PnrA-like domain-containing protein n=1 Tax=Potamilus streckersoni TaxID=2493646 RepID=A0AAE0WB74_9BIVA|nr:hypothetical protein CHS0354_006919 [Potamilus streckersoni]